MRVNEPLETVGELINIRIWNFIMQDILLFLPNLQPELIHIMEKGADCSSAGEWLVYTLRHIINLIYGEPLL